MSLSVPSSTQTTTPLEATKKSRPTIERSDYLLQQGKSYLQAGDYGAASGFLRSARQGYLELDQELRVNECNGLLIQCVAQPRLPSPPSTVVRTGSVAHATGAPASSYRRLISPPSSTPVPVGKYDERTQYLLDRLNRVPPKGPVVHFQFPHVLQGFKTQAQPTSGTK